MTETNSEKVGESRQASSSANNISSANNNDNDNSADKNVELKKELGLIDGVAIIVGVIIGAGIFVSPKGVLKESGSTGLALIVWASSGILSLIGACCYAELGTMIPQSGGDYTYLMTAFGPLPGFLFLWVAMLIIVPTGSAILSLTFTSYLLQPFYDYEHCYENESGPPDIVIRIISGALIALLTAINCYNVKWVARLQGFFSAQKLIALFIVILAGVVVFIINSTTEKEIVSENYTNGYKTANGSFFENLFEGTTTNPGKIALAFYSGLFSYAGWNYLNFVTEELKDPFRNLPRAIWISLPIVTIAYTLANASYFIVLSKNEILMSNAVAVTFGDVVLGNLYMSWIMPVFVSLSCVGALNANIYSPSRLVYVAARNGHLPKFLAIININTFTPIPALILLACLSMLMLLIQDVYILINYLCFVEALAMGLSVTGLVWLRYKQPNWKRPIKVSLSLPIIFILVSIFLIAVPILTSPANEIIAAIIIITSGIPFYFIFIYWKNKPAFLLRISDKLDRTSAIFFNGTLQKQDYEEI